MKNLCVLQYTYYSQVSFCCGDFVRKFLFPIINARKNNTLDILFALDVFYYIGILKNTYAKNPISSSFYVWSWNESCISQTPTSISLWQNRNLRRHIISFMNLLIWIEPIFRWINSIFLPLNLEIYVVIANTLYLISSMIQLNKVIFELIVISVLRIIKQIIRNNFKIKWIVLFYNLLFQKLIVLNWHCLRKNVCLYNVNHLKIETNSHTIIRSEK